MRLDSVTPLSLGRLDDRAVEAFVRASTQAAPTTELLSTIEELTAGPTKLRLVGRALGVPKRGARLATQVAGQIALAKKEAARATSLAALAEPVAADRLDTALVALVTQAATRLDGRGLVLVAADSESGPFALGAGMQCTADVQNGGGLVAGVLDGRGGGSGRLYTGRADRLHKLPEALDLLRHAVAETPS